MKTWQSLDVQLMNEAGRSLPLSDVVVDLEFFLNGVYRYAFRVGSTDASGRLRIDYETVERERNWEAELQPADYNTRLDECDDFVTVRIPSLEVLEKGAEAAKSWGVGDSERVESWLSAANRQISAEPISVKLVSGVTPVSVACSERTRQ